MAGSTLLKYLLKTNIVKSIYFDIISKVSRYYYAYGRTTPWPTVTAFDVPTQQTVVVSSEEVPPAAVDSYSYELSTRRNITYMKQVNANDAAIVVNRVDWTAGTVYDMYDDYSADYLSYSGASSIDQAVFYVLTTEFNVYKCLFNNGNGQSYVQPTGTSTEPFTTSDGYIWKFMYTIPLYLRNKFLSAAYMPVITALSNQFYSNGAITSYTIENTGHGYVPTAWKVKRIIVLQGGKGYTNNTFHITFPNPTAPGGVRATAALSSLGDLGDIQSISITNHGSGYLTQPIPTIVDGTGVGFSYIIEYERSSSSWTEIRVTGDGYNEDNPYSLKKVTVDPAMRGEWPTGSLPSSDPFTYNAAIRKYGSLPVVNVTYRQIGVSGYYEVDTVEVIDPGYGFTEPLVFGQNVFMDNDPDATFNCDLNASSQKNEAILIPLINSSGELESIQVSSPGVGYTYATARVVGVQELLPGDHASAFDFSTNPDDPGYVEGYVPAEILLNFGVGDIDTKQSNVELLAVEGSIPVVVVENGGFGYSATTTLTVAGDGTGLVCNPIIVNGTVTGVQVTNPGQGYTYANITPAGAGSGATFRAIISPKGGHGKDAISELYASTIMLVSRLSGEKNQTIPAVNDFRQISIIKNPKQYNANSYFRNAIGYTCALLECDVNSVNTAGFIGFKIDDVLTQLNDSTKTYTLIEKLSANNKYYLLVQINDNAVPASGNTLYIGDYNMSVTAVTNPTINKFSGEMLYIDNRVKFASSDEQTIVTSTLISF